MHYLTFLWKIYKQAIQIRKYICENVPTVEKEYTMKIETEKARKLKSKILDSETFPFRQIKLPSLFEAYDL